MGKGGGREAKKREGLGFGLGEGSLFSRSPFFASLFPLSPQTPPSLFLSLSLLSLVLLLSSSSATFMIITYITAALISRKTQHWA